MIFGVLTVDSQDQALERVGGEGAIADKGAEAAIAAIRMAEIARKL